MSLPSTEMSGSETDYLPHLDTTLPCLRPPGWAQCSHLEPLLGFITEKEYAALKAGEAIRPDISPCLTESKYVPLMFVTNHEPSLLRNAFLWNCPMTDENAESRFVTLLNDITHRLKFFPSLNLNASRIKDALGKFFKALPSVKEE